MAGGAVRINSNPGEHKGSRLVAGTATKRISGTNDRDWLGSWVNHIQIHGTWVEVWLGISGNGWEIQQKLVGCMMQTVDLGRWYIVGLNLLDHALVEMRNSKSSRLAAAATAGRVQDESSNDDLQFMIADCSSAFGAEPRVDKNKRH